MRVLLCSFSRPFPQSDGPWPLWTPPFREGLEACGCEVVEPKTVDLIEPFLRRADTDWILRNRSALAGRLLDEVRRLHREKPLDLIFTYFWEFQVDAAGMRAITDLGIPTVNFFCDNVREFSSVEPLVRSFTLNWVPEVGALPLYRRAGAPHVHLPMSASPSRFPFEERPEKRRVVFIGSADVVRRHLLDQVRDRLPLRVGGEGWAPAATGEGAPSGAPRRSFADLAGTLASHAARVLRHGPRAEWNHFEQKRVELRLAGRFADLALDTRKSSAMLEAFWDSAVTLGINRFPTPEAPLERPRCYSRLRDLEAPMAGAAYLTERTEDLPHLFEEGKEVLAYRTADELVAQAERMLEDPALRRRLRREGRRRALAEHTWERRFRDLFRHLGLKPPRVP
ncbi:MAG: glycosyltransferase [Verrucomicrobiae bacterium]|nr:glycosyltransferase [Verrucomicrobiae bacterium]